MAGNIQANPAAAQVVAQVGYQPNLCSGLYQSIEVITQIAIKILFVAGSILMAAYAFPIAWHAVAIPVIAIGTTALAGFFYPQSNHLFGPLFPQMQPLIRPVQIQPNGELPADFPADAPRGFHNISNNCPFNSMAQFLDAEPRLAQWMRQPLPENVDLAGFQNFLARYNPPADLVARFNEYAAAQPAPQPTVPLMFTAFLANYAPPPADRGAVDAIQTKFRNLQLLQGAFGEFYRANDEAIQARQARSAGNSQNLRLALNRVTPLVDPNPHVQMDVSEVMGPYLDVLPDDLKMRVETTYHLNAGQLPQMAELPAPKQESVGFISLPIPQGVQALNLPDIFQNYRVNGEAEAQRRVGVDGVARDYPVERVTVELLDPPPALRFHIKRFTHEHPPVSLLSRCFPSLFPPLLWRPVKLDPPIECPNEMTVTLKDGRVCRYRLSSFVNHHGVCGGGHYTAAREVNGNKYLMSDGDVTLVDPEHGEIWSERLRHAYLLNYLPIPDQAPV